MNFKFQIHFLLKQILEIGLANLVKVPSTNHSEVSVSFIH